MTLCELWLEYAIAAYGRQWHLARVLGDHDWRWRADDGTLWLRSRGSEAAGEKAAPRYCLKAQALGTESLMTETWLWIWANPRHELDDELLEAALRLRAIGEERGVPELTQGEFPLTQADGAMLSLLAVGLLNGGAYYRGEYLGGAGFVMIDDPQWPPFEAPDAAQTQEIIDAALLALKIPEPRRAVEKYLLRSGWALTSAGELLHAARGGEQITARFAAGVLAGWG